MDVNVDSGIGIDPSANPLGRIARVADENNASAGSADKASAMKKNTGAGERSRSGKMAEDVLTVRGFKFSTLADAKTAEEEYKKMVYIQQRMNKNNPEEVLSIYDKMIENGLFVTPVGVDFLMRVREFLEECGSIEPERIRPIETGSLFTQRARNEARAATRPRVTTDLVAENNKLKHKYYIALTTSIISIILVAVMFFVARSSDNPNILNYKTAVENQYADWEESLSQREQELRQREEALENGQD
ncbi:MAG: hypothetical protein K6E34_02610 [Lachnospiraceae bacterium]|nr:hypothetical protein [Lachnospiraceae bacterium]